MNRRDFIARPTPESLVWQLELPIAEFRKWRSDAGEILPEALQLHRVVIYTINNDADLELESVEMLRE